MAPGAVAEAWTAYRTILALRPDIAEVHSNLGMLLWHQGQFEPALESFGQALALKPELADAYYRLLEAQKGQDQPRETAARFEQALAAAHVKLGIALREQERFDEAAIRLQRALALNPRNAEAHHNLGMTRWQQGRFDEAATCYRQAVALQPDHVDALANLGHTLREQFKLTEAREAFERLLAIQPDSPSAELGLGICYLVQEDYERGWPAFEGRLRLPGARPLPDFPRWTGQPLAGRSLLLVGEAGLGDTLHFVRYARLLKARGARVVLAAQPALGRLLGSHPDVDEFFSLDCGRAAALRFLFADVEHSGGFSDHRRDHSPRRSLPLGRPRVDRPLASGAGADRRLQDRHRLARLAGFYFGSLAFDSIGRFRAVGQRARRAADQPAKRTWLGANRRGRFSGARFFRSAG